MFRYQSNKKAFVIAVSVILLCAICLTGATLALFTSGGKDGTIGIITTTGVVEVDLVDAADEETSLVGQVLQILTSSDNKNILFEPGAVFCTQGFKVKNKGNIPINFSLSVSKNVKVDQESFDKGFELWISTSPNIGSAERLDQFKGRLEADQCSETYYLFMKMRETAGNEYQGKTYSGIGVTVYAVQGNVDIKE